VGVTTLPRSRRQCRMPTELRLIALDPETISVFRTGEGDEGGLRISARCRVGDDVTFDTVRLQTAFWSGDGRLLGCEEGSIDLDFMTDGAVLFSVNHWPNGVGFARVARIELRTFARGRLHVGDASFEVTAIPTLQTLGRVGVATTTIGPHELGIVRRPDSSDMNLDVVGRMRQLAGIPCKEARLATALLDAQDRVVSRDESTIELMRFDAVGSSEPTPFRVTSWYKLGFWELASRVAVRLDLVLHQSSGPIVVTADAFLSAPRRSDSDANEGREPAAEVMTAEGVDE